METASKIFKEWEMNIYEKMLKITEEVERVRKNLKVDTGKGKSYKAVSEADVLAAVKPIEIKYGVYSFPVSRTIIDSGEITTENQYGKTTRLFMRIETIYRFLNTEKPEEYVDIKTYGDGVDSQDKAPGKAMTYSDKYALLKAYKIETGDDPDQTASEPLAGYTSTKPVISQKERETLENIAKKAGLDVYTIKGYPNISPEEYAVCMQQARKALDGNEGKNN